jgi:tetratricopeptide (TPR) repeat protein
MRTPQHAGYHYTFGMLPLALALLFWLSLPTEVHQQGVALYKQHKYSEAIAALETASKSEHVGSNDYKESMLLIGQSYFMLSQAPKAIPWLERLPYPNEASYMLGYAYLQTGQQARSEEAFARLFGLNPKSAAGHLLAGQMMLKKEFEAQAVDEVHKALALDPKIPEAHFLLAEIAIYRGRIEEGIADLQKELAINPNFSMAWYRLGDARVRQNDWDSAIADLQRSIWLNAEYSAPYILMGKCYMKKSDYSNAEGFLKHAVSLDPKNYMATYLLGQALNALGRTDEGKAMLQKSQTLQH